MPYCPKCDMEFVEGITVCSDCGGPLYPSKEEVPGPEEAVLDGADSEAFDGGIPIPAKAAPAPVRPRAYIKKSQKYEDMKSSVSAFLLVGVIMGAFALLCWTGILKMPMNGISKYLIQGVITFMALGCFAVAFFTNRSARKVFGQIEGEEKQTRELIDWFVAAYSQEDLDQQLTGEFKELSEEELSLKRFELIQDLLITHKDLPDQAYVDALCEDIYGKVFEA